MINDDTYIETAGASIAIPGDMPEWVTPELIIEATESQPQSADLSVPANGMLTLVDTEYGPVYLAPGAPDWVNQNTIDQARALFESRTTVPPPPPPPPPVAPSPGGIINRVVDAGRSVAGTVGAIIGGAAGAVASVATGVADTVASVTAGLIPTIQELALGLTSRFADLASNIASKTIDFGTYSFQLAVDAANAMGGVLDEAWSWILKALVGFFSVLLAPLESLAKSLTSNLLDPAL